MGDDGAGAKVVAAATVALGLPVLVVWAGAALAAWWSGLAFDAGLADAVTAALALPGHLHDPAAAWEPPINETLPGPVIYWAGTAVAVVVVALAAIAASAVWRHVRRVGTTERRRLGVDARAWLARPRDLRPLFVSGPQPGRFILGRAGRHLIATECRDTTRPSRRPWVRRRQGDTGAVALIGPTRSGKTVAAVAGILEWDGPAILSSVKTDLMSATIGWRARHGEVRVYDPLHLTPAAAAGWSPLAQAGSITGARRAARNLLETLADDGTSNFGMWRSLAEYLVAGLFWVAANTGRDMGSVVQWVLTQDRPRPDGASEVEALLRELLAHHRPEIATSAPVAMDYLLSTWNQDERPRSSVYVTAQAALAPFADPAIAKAARCSEIDLDWLLGGNNTIYISSPLKDQQRLAPAFGGLVNDLMTQCYERANRSAAGRLDRRVLVVLDEAGNQRLDQLPEYASTVSGLGVQLVTIWQSMAQITRAHDKGAGIVVANHLSKLFYTGLSDGDSLDYVAKVLGEEEIESRQLSDHPPATRTDVTDSTTRVALAQAHVLRQMRPGDALLIHGTLPPAHIHTRRYYTERRLRARASLPIPPALHRSVDDDGARGDQTLADVLEVFAYQRDDLLKRVDALAQSSGNGFGVVERKGE